MALTLSAINVPPYGINILKGDINVDEDKKKQCEIVENKK